MPKSSCAYIARRLFQHVCHCGNLDIQQASRQMIRVLGWYTFYDVLLNTALDVDTFRTLGSDALHAL